MWHVANVSDTDFREFFIRQVQLTNSSSKGD
jgi:hypothetical protein